MKRLEKAEMKRVVAGKVPRKECAANCNPGFVSVECAGTCTATTDVGIKCGSVITCCFGGTCNP
jgi:hypothetical protein